MPNFYPGYLTPDSVPFDDHCRTFKIPNDVQWLSVFMGALLPLIYPESWQKYGTLTPDESAEVMLNVIWDAYESDEGICPVLEAPYWDTYANVDDQEPEGAPETWYGELVPASMLRRRAAAGGIIVELLDDDELTWRENLGIWAIAGFIAYAGQIGGAIAFIPFARRFVLKFRGNPLGAIAEIFIDGAKLTTLDTASAEDRIKAIDIQLPDDDEHEIWVAVGEDSPPGSSLQVVRKELNPNEVYPDNLRYSEDCDCVQQTYDGGDTWVDQPGQDPRHSTTFQFPPVTADDPRCQAAANMAAYFENLIGTALNVMSTGLDALGLATTIMPIFVELGPFAILFDLGLGLASGLIGLGVDVISSEFTPETYDALECIFYCAVEGDGSVTAADLAAINAKIAADLNPDVQLIMGLCFFLMGEVGLSNAGTIGEAPADCDECACDHCYFIDLKASDGSADGVVIQGGTWLPGQGIQGASGGGTNFSDAYGYWAFPETLEVIGIEIFFDKPGGGGANNVNNFYALYPGATSYNVTNFAVNTLNPIGTDQAKSIDGIDHDLDGMGWDINSGTDTVQVYVTGLQVKYRNESPPWEDNC